MMFSRTIPVTRTGLRAFSTSLRAQKTVTETVKEKAQDLNLKAGKTLAAGLESAENAANATKEAVGMGAKDVQKKAEQASEVGSQKMNQATAEARGKAEDLKQKGKQALE